jgi:glycosyltransferase involved in cell wall biosynthesis
VRVNPSPQNRSTGVENVTVVIPFFNGHTYIGRLLDTLPTDLPVIIVDDHSDHRLHLNNRNVTIIRPEEKGYFSGATNAGIEACETDVLVVNQDIWFEGTEWIDLIEKNRAEYGIIGDGVMDHPTWSKGYVQGTFMFMRRDAIEATGLLNVEDYPFWGATAEWQLRMCRKDFKALPVKPVPGMMHERDKDKGRNFGQAMTTMLKRNPGKKGHWVRTPPLVSVIVPCYNHAKYLPDLLASLMGGKSVLGTLEPQSLQSFEVIIVDDFSRYGKKLLPQFDNPWKGVKVLQHRINMGTAAACNTGIRAARGRYITRIDADDMMEKDRLDRLYRAALEHPGSVIYDDMRIIARGRRSKIWKMREYDFDEILWKNSMHAGIFYPRKGWQDAGGYPEIMNRGREDWAFNIALGIRGYCGVHIDYPGYLYRREGQNRTLHNTSPRWRQRFLDQLQDLFTSVYKGVRPMGCCGGRRSRAAARTVRPGVGRTIIMKDLPGRKGMVLIEYLGLSAGTQTWFGEVTGTRYLFGGRQKVGYVDQADAEILLTKVKGGKPIFRIFEQPEAAKKKAPKPKAKEPELEGIKEIHIESKDLVVDPGTMSIPKLETYLGTVVIPQNELKKILDAEVSGQNRKGAVELLEGLLE